MKYIKKKLQIVEAEIDEDGYYVVERVHIAPDIFQRVYQPLGFILSPEELEIVQNALLSLRSALINAYCNVPEIEPSLRKSRIKVDNLLKRIKQFQENEKNKTLDCK